MQLISLKNFIINGYWGSITLGSSIDSVIQELGKNYDYTDCGETQIIQYGWYEFFFRTDTRKIFGIQNDHLISDCSNHADMIDYQGEHWKLDTWFLRPQQNITFEQVVQLLQDTGIPFSIEPAYAGCDENIIRCVESMVSFDFVNEYSEPVFDKKGELVSNSPVIAMQQKDYFLNGIRLFNLV
ncbi:hypothetical protein [Chitinophaga sp. Cy-1792]|uniref:hypothetical protein n=1 Tax=Chitinophaga sp. Cy-1792 TaxID=2608339 RepID=UPI0014231897|nr:hypothetical protein [Chitinophaga sp. Cy-1792]NIG54053.1 hypothetical protein [Chitinophaga sp. Cy-1792]